MEFWLCANTVFPKNFLRCVCWALGKKRLGFVVVSFLSSQLSDFSPRPAPKILWKSGFAQVLFSQGFSGCVFWALGYVGHLENPRFCSSQLSDKS